MALHLDPRVPLVWRSTTALQFGIDTALVRLETVSNADERMIAALFSGVSRAGLSVVGEAAHASESDVEALLGALGPVIVEGRSDETAAAQPVPHVVIDGDGEAAATIGRVLGRDGLRVSQRTTGRGAASADLAVIVADFVIAPQRHGAWLRRDVPHLPVVFGDAAVRIGPLVEPGSGPCLYCLELARTDADASWPAMAAQLLRHSSPLDSALIKLEVAAMVARIVADRLTAHENTAEQRGAAGTSLTNSSLLLDAATGGVSAERHRPHAECGCRALPENVTALADRRVAGPSVTSSGATGSARG
jgi:bacteriocin biosynthesis cyclodehydratase domain-containing protein